MPYSEKFLEAFLLAEQLHRNQNRKGLNLPYITHLMIVAGITAEYGGDENQVIAALLHDSIEDAGITRDEIENKFGADVAMIVADLTDTDQIPKPPWRERKEKYIRHLHQSSERSLLVSAADKLHNCQSIIRDLEVSGPEVWKRFNAAPPDLAWYYKSVADAIARRLPNRIADELSLAAVRLEELVDEI